MKKLKNLATTLIATLTLISCTNKIEENDWTKDNLKGKVKSYTEFSYKAVERFSDIEKVNRERENSWEYDIQKKYDQKGNMIEKNELDSDGSLLKKEIFKYNDELKMIESNVFYSDGSLKEKIAYKYDEKSNKVQMSSYDSDGSLIMKHTYMYDKKGNMSEDNIYYEGRLLRKHIYIYDEKGNMIEENDINSFKSELDPTSSKHTYKYDNYGNIIERRHYNLIDNRLLSNTVNRYDKNNKVIEFKYFISDGKLSTNITYKYDEKGNLTEEYNYWYGSLDYKYIYLYDENGNWIKRIKFKNEIPTYILEREYEYY
jgi:hypothetical protein